MLPLIARKSAAVGNPRAVAQWVVLIAGLTDRPVTVAASPHSGQSGRKMRFVRFLAAEMSRKRTPRSIHSGFLSCCLNLGFWPGGGVLGVGVPPGGPNSKELTLRPSERMRDHALTLPRAAKR